MLRSYRKTVRVSTVIAALFVGAAVSAEAMADLASLQPQSLNQTGVYGLQQLDPTLDGSGVSLAVICKSITYIDGEPQNDYRPNMAHDCLKDANLTFKDQGNLPSGISGHSTTISSILFGSDDDASAKGIGQFKYHGVVPKARGEIYEFWYFLTNNVFPHARPDADMITLGIGTKFEDWWTRGIEAMAEHYGLPVVASIGNGTDASDSLLHPGASANAIGVGVVNSVDSNDLATVLGNFALAYPESSSGGRTTDGRTKPDIVAPGNCLAADVNETDKYQAAGDWSSFSTPIAAGTVGLLIQKAKQQDNLALALTPQGGNSVIKAVLMNSATKLPYWHKGALTTADDHTTPLDHIQGAGMLNALAAYEQLTAARQEPGNTPDRGWDNNTLDRAKSPLNIYRISVTDPAEKRITATLAWNRHYKRTYPFDAIEDKNANLRLELWAVDPNNAEPDKLIDSSDSEADNVEHIYARTDPNYTEYEIVVIFSDIEDAEATAMTERYALAWNTATTAGDDQSLFWHDLNADGVVDNADFSILLKNWTRSLESSEGYRFCDLNGDGTIDIEDLKILLINSDRRADWYDKTGETE